MEPNPGTPRMEHLHIRIVPGPDGQPMWEANGIKYTISESTALLERLERMEQERTASRHYCIKCERKPCISVKSATKKIRDLGAQYRQRTEMYPIAYAACMLEFRMNSKMQTYLRNNGSSDDELPECVGTWVDAYCCMNMIEK